MDAGFASAVAEWHEFFAAVAGVSATLVGLLFVSLALNPLVMGDRRPAGLRTWAGQTFHNFLMVLTVALVALIPEQTTGTVGATLLIIGALGVFRVASDVRRTRTDPSPQWQERSALMRFASPLAGYLCCLMAGIGAWRGDADELYWLIGFVFFLMFSAASSCWDLLKVIGDRGASDGDGDAADPNR
jgi:hypothetical protein